VIRASSSWLVALSLLLALPAHAKDPELAKRIQRGIDDIYKMEFDDCEQTFRDLLKSYPGLPYAYFGLATASWARFEYQEEESSLARHDEFERRIKDAIVHGNAWVKAHPEDADGLVCVSGMYGMRARLSLMLHSWVFAYLDGRSALKLIERAQKADPAEYDAYTGLGMWDYYADTLPKIIKALGRIVAIHGDAKRGIQRLKLAADRGEHTSTAAKLILIELMQDRTTPYYDPEQGLKMIREVRARFPMNPLFQFVEIIYLYEARRPNEAALQAQDFLQGIKEGRRFYEARYAPRGYVGLAAAYCMMRDFDKAEAALTEAVNIMEREGGPNRWGLWALVRRGQLRDVRRNRPGAFQDYRRALQLPDLWEIRDIAKLHLKQPATEKDLLGPIPPP